MSIQTKSDSKDKSNDQSDTHYKLDIQGVFYFYNFWKNRQLKWMEKNQSITM